MARELRLLGIAATGLRLSLGLGLALGLFAACDEPVASRGTCSGDCSCSGNRCTCNAGATCTFGRPNAAEAGATMDAAPPPDDVTYQCMSENTCDFRCGADCTIACDGRSTCEGSCGASCAVTCTGVNDCALATGANAAVTCVHAKCTLSLGSGSSVRCHTRSICDISCPEGGCAVDCARRTDCTDECAGIENTVCTVECGGSVACPIACDGTHLVDCAPGTTCEDPCDSRRR